MRACEQCGLSIGDTATFCSVCGARADAAVRTAAPPPVATAAHTGVRVSGWGVDQSHGVSRAGEDPASRRLHEASLAMHEAGEREKTDPARAAAMYRKAMLRFLEAAEDPLDREDVRRDLLFSFDRLSLVLKRNGRQAEALEEIDCAASLGLLDGQDSGTKGRREALKKRRDSLRRGLAKASPGP